MGVPANELVYDFRATGTVQGMHHDCFNLGFLGAQKIQRASDIRFDEQKQQWDIWLFVDEKWVAPIPALSGFNGYDEARKFEVQALNACRLAGVSPASIAASLIIGALRSKPTEA